MEREVFSAKRRLTKIVHDVPRFLAGGHWLPALIDVFDMATMQAGASDSPERTYIAGTEVPPPESVPLTSGDFESEAERAALMEPWRVTDEAGALLPEWRSTRPVFQPRVPASRRKGIAVGSGVV
jgi:hypothetical protein